MKKLTTIILFCASLLTANFLFAANATSQLSPVGLWQTIDDVTGKPKGIVQISETNTHELTGKILKIFPGPGHDQNEVCSECDGARHNQRIVGMTFLENMKQSTDNQLVWNSGTILDPKNGKIYRCTMQVANGGAHLNVRGYIGIALLGRTQTWNRVVKG